jgi:hypothetical protein
MTEDKRTFILCLMPSCGEYWVEGWQADGQLQITENIAKAAHWDKASAIIAQAKTWKDHTIPCYIKELTNDL